jgi:hypothetical protein
MNLSRSYYNLGSCISDTTRGLKRFLSAEAISLNGQNILFAIKVNAIHQCSKPEDPSTESNPNRFGLPTNNPRQHRRQ